MSKWDQWLHYTKKKHALPVTPLWFCDFLKEDRDKCQTLDSVKKYLDTDTGCFNRVKIGGL